MSQLNPKATCWQDSFLLGGDQNCFVAAVLVRPSTDWMRPTPPMEDNLLDSKSTDINVHLNQKYPHRDIPSNA